MTERSASWAVLLAVLALYGTEVAPYIDYVNDDAYITFRYSRNLATGNGPYFNPGERVEGYTNPSLMLAMAGVFAVGGEVAVPVAAKVLGALAAAATLLFVVGVARRLGPRAGLADRESLTWGAVAAGLVAISPGFAVNSVSGLETSLFAVCLAAAIWCDSGPRAGWRGVAAWLSLAVLTRPEGIFIAAVYVGVRLLMRFAPGRGAAGGGAAGGIVRQDDDVRRLLWTGLTVVVVFVLHLLLRFGLYDGEWLPNTYYAKAGGFWGTGAWQYVRAGAMVPLLGLGGVALGLLGWVVPGRSRRAAVPLAVTAVAGVALPFAVGTDWMIGWRFSAPFLPLFALAVVFGWLRLTGLGGRRREAVALSLVIALPAAWLMQSTARRQLETEVTIRSEGYRNGHTALADWLCDERAAPGDGIALMDIGIVSYRCFEQRVLDITGLTDRFIARSPGGFLKKRYDPAYILDQEPEFVVLAYVVGGDPRQPPPLDAAIRPWSPLEVRLSEQPAFERLYRRRPPLGPPAADWKVHYAQRLGATRVFAHAHPEIHYLLAVFERQSVAR